LVYPALSQWRRPGKEPLFLAAQLGVLLIFGVLGVAATIRCRPQSARVA
jgi:hypothetical protein